MQRAITVALAILGALVLLAAVGLFVAWPGLLTGSACEVTIDAVDVDVEGTIRIEYHASLAYRTYVATAAPIAKGEVTCVADRHAWEECPPRFLRWARLAKDGSFGVYARMEDPRSEESKGPDLAAIRAGLTVKPGTYRVRPGENLVYWRGRDSKGVVYEGSISVRFSK